MVGPLGKSGGALLSGFLVQEVFQLSPGFRHLDLTGEHELVLRAAPVHEVLRLPPPFC